MKTDGVKGYCSICARGGSKGVKNKNLIEINGLPLLAHSIKQAKATQLFELIAVSSDSDEILKCAEEYGADLMVKRPDEMATDTAGKLEVIQHCARTAEEKYNKQWDFYVDIDATSPLRVPEDIIGSVKLLETEHENIITGSHSRRSPYFNLVEENKGTPFVTLSKQGSQNFLRRQDVPHTFDMNASIYAWSRTSLFESQKVITDKTKIFIMPEERSWDIDSPFDLKIVKYLMESNSEQYRYN